MANRLAAIEAKLDTNLVSSIKNPLFSHHHQNHRFYNSKTLFEMDIPRFDGTDLTRQRNILEWIFKINHFFPIFITR